MTHALTSLSTLPLPDAKEPGTPPDWVHLLPKGPGIRARDGRGPWHYDDAAEVIRASLSSAQRIHIDENHSTDLMAKVGGTAPARGYITELEERENGIWGRVDWTQSGTALLADRSYWGISPVIAYHKSGPNKGQVTAIRRAALTNDPAIQELTALNSAQGDADMFLPKVAKMLGLEEDASEEAVMAALGKRLDAKSDLAPLAAALGQEGETDIAKLTTLATVAMAASTAQTESLATLQAEVATLKAGNSERDGQAFLTAALQAGRAIPATVQDDIVALHADDPERAKRMVESFPKLTRTHTTDLPPKKRDGQGVAALSTDEAGVAEMLGIDPAKFAENLIAEETR